MGSASTTCLHLEHPTYPAEVSQGALYDYRRRMGSDVTVCECLYSVQVHERGNSPGFWVNIIHGIHLHGRGDLSSAERVVLAQVFPLHEQDSG